MSNNAQIQARIKILEGEFPGKSGNQLGKDAGLGNTTVDGWNDNQIGKPTLAVKEFLKFYNIRGEWWATMEGPIFKGKPTHGQIEPAITEKPLGGDPEVYRTIVEGKTEYVLIPRTTMQDSKLIAKEQFTETIEMMRTDREMMKSDRQIMVLLMNEFLAAVKRLESSPESAQSQKRKHSR